VELGLEAGFDFIQLVSATTIHVSVVPDSCESDLDIIFLLDGSDR
jgi:hypothetical protein